jgi:hypothetical protein
LHCNDGQYPKIAAAAKDLCRQYDTVVICINGDFVTKIVPGKGSDWVVIAKNTDASGSHKDRLRAFMGFCNELLLNDKLWIVFNLGNHEFMHPDEVTDVLEILVPMKQVYVVSNIDPGIGPFRRLVVPFIDIAGIRFAGYCTNEIYSKNNSYRYAQQRKCFVGGWRDHNRRFEDTIRNVNTPGLYILSHETRDKSAQYVWPMVLKCCPASVRFKLIAIGHDHFDFRQTTSSRRFGNCQAHLGHFSGADRVLFVPPYGFGMEVLTFPQFPKSGPLMELVDYKFETRSLSDRFDGKFFH